MLYALALKFPQLTEAFLTGYTDFLQTVHASTLTQTREDLGSMREWLEERHSAKLPMA